MSVIFPNFSLMAGRNAIIVILIVVISVTTIFAYTLVPKRAEAFLGIADTTFNFTIGDIPEMLLEILQIAVARFLTKLLLKAVQYAEDRIRQGFMVKNFLKYDAILTNRRYLVDYIVSYIPPGPARRIAWESVRAYRQGGMQYYPGNSTYFKNAADQYRGYTLASLSPSDPNYLLKLANQSDLWSSDIGQYYAAVDNSFIAASQAERAAELNMTSPGIKSSYNGEAYVGTDTGYVESGKSDPSMNIATSVALINNTEQSIMNVLYGGMQSQLGGFMASIAMAVGNAIGDMLTSVLTDGRVYEEFKDFAVLTRNDATLEEIAGLPAPLNQGTLSNPAYTRSGLPIVPDVCKGTGATASTNLGSGSVTGGSVTTATSTATGGSASVDLSNGTISAGDPAFCATLQQQQLAQQQLDTIVNLTDQGLFSP